MVSVFWLKQLLKHNWMLFIWSSWMSKSSLPAPLPILLRKGGAWCEEQKLPLLIFIILFQTANKSSSLEASGGNFAFDSLPFFPICGLKLIGSAGFFFFPKMLKLFDWLWLWYSYPLPMKIDCSYGTKTVFISLGNLLTLIKKQKLALIR